MGTMRVQCAFPSITAFPEDAVVNTFHFSTTGAGPPSIAQAQAAIRELDRFYSENTNAAASLSDFMSATLLANPTQVQYGAYAVDPATGLSGSPIYEENRPIAPAAVDPLPQEVALCITFHADLANVAEVVPAGAAGPAGDLKPRARRRGRIFIGNLGVNSLSFATGHVRVLSQLRTVAMEASSRLNLNLATGIESAAGVRLAVYSRVDGTVRDVTGGWVDNAFDTQRRRGPAASARVSWAAA